MKKMLAGAALVLVPVATGLGFAGDAAAATNYDPDGYRAALADDGIPWSDQYSLSVGNGICAKLNQGESAVQLINDTAANASVPRWVIFDIVIDAHDYLCPNPSDGHAPGPGSPA